MQTVTVACKLPNGLHMEIARDGQPKVRFTLNGARRRVDANNRELNVEAHDVAFTYGLTHGIPKDFWDAWIAENEHYGPVANGLIFAQAKEADSKAMARERKDLKSGLEPINPEKPDPTGKVVPLDVPRN